MCGCVCINTHTVFSLHSRTHIHSLPYTLIHKHTALFILTLGYLEPEEAAERAAESERTAQNIIDGLRDECAELWDRLRQVVTP